MSHLSDSLTGIHLVGPSIKAPRVLLVASVFTRLDGYSSSATLMLTLDHESPAYLRSLADEAEALLAKAEALKALNASNEVPA